MDDEPSSTSLSTPRNLLRVVNAKPSAVSDLPMLTTVLSRVIPWLLLMVISAIILINQNRAKYVEFEEQSIKWKGATHTITIV